MDNDRRTTANHRDARPDRMIDEIEGQSAYPMITPENHHGFDALELNRILTMMANIRII
jgi:hypothetical protein